MATTVSSKRTHTRLLKSSAIEVRKEALITAVTLGPILLKPEAEQRSFADAAEQKGTACDLFVAACILGDLGSRAGASTHGAWQMQKSHELMERAAEKGSPSAAMQLGVEHRARGRPKEAMAAFKKAAILGHPEGMFAVAESLDDDPEARDVEQAAKYYTMAAEEGHAAAMNNLALLIEEGSISAAPADWSLERLRSDAAKLGDINSKVSLVKSHMPLDFVEDTQLRDLLVRLLMEAFAEAPTNESATFLLGMHYMPRDDNDDGATVNPFVDKTKALFFLKRLKIQGSQFAAVTDGWVTALEENSATGERLEKEPRLKTLLTEAAQRIATAVDEAYDTALRSALEEFKLLEPKTKGREEEEGAGFEAEEEDSRESTIDDLRSLSIDAKGKQKELDGAASARVRAAPAASFVTNGVFSNIILFCGLEGCDVTLNLKQCARCKKVAYCSREHQQEAWKVHRKVCKVL